MQLALGGDPKSILKIHAARKEDHSMPVIILKGSGEAANLLEYVLRFGV